MCLSWADAARMLRTHRSSTMKSGLRFLVAARQCEIAELEQLALTSELVSAPSPAASRQAPRGGARKLGAARRFLMSLIGRLIHALQKERGISNVFLGSNGTRFGDQRLAQVLECQMVEQEVRQHFNRLDTASGKVRNGPRVFSRIAFVLHALDALPALRQRIAAQALPPEEATATMVRMVAGLLVVVFEAADSATDPEISRSLVALFNFMQGKEFAGQERAAGSAAFASGQADALHQQQWLHSIASQERCFEAFTDFSDDAVTLAWNASQSGASLAALERLRRIGCAFNLETAAGCARVGRHGVGWQGETTLRALARKEEQRGQRAPGRLNRACSVVTPKGEMGRGYER